MIHKVLNVQVSTEQVIPKLQNYFKFSYDIVILKLVMSVLILKFHPYIKLNKLLFTNTR